MERKEKGKASAKVEQTTNESKFNMQLYDDSNDSIGVWKMKWVC